MKKRDDAIPTPESATAWGDIPLTTKVYNANEVETKLSAITTQVAKDIADAVSTAYKFKGSVDYAIASDVPAGETSATILPTSGMKNGDVYNIAHEFTLGGNTYTAGTDVAWIEDKTETDGGHWNALGGKTFDDSGTVKSVNGQAPDSNGVVTIPEATASASGVMSATDKAALDGHLSNATIHVTAEDKTSWNGAVSDLATHTANTTVHITADERAAWNAKYDKPSTGIPSTDMTAEVQASLGKANTALQEHQDISGKAEKSEMSVSTSGDKTTITLKDGTSATVLNAHQDISGKVDKEAGKGLSTNDYTTDEKTKLAGVAAGAEVNQNAFSNVKIGATTIAASSKADTVTLVGGTNITLTPDATNKTITIAGPETLDISGKADKVANATSGNFAGLDANGNLTNSGSKATDFAAATHTHAISDVTNLQTALDGKVDKVEGKQLSAEDYTTAEKTKLSGIAAGAQVNVIETVKVNGTALTPDANKAVDVSVPTLTDSTDTTSSTVAASATAVKAAKDAADTADGKAVTAQGGVDAIETRATALLAAVGAANPIMTTANEIKAAVEALYNALRAFATKA